MTDNRVNMRTITLNALWELFLRKAVAVVLSALVVGGGMLIYSAAAYEPAYSSTATLYILRQDESPTSGDASNDFSLALKVVTDCSHLLKSHTVLDEVIDNLGLTLSYQQLYDRITIHNPENSRILEVTVQAESAEDAKWIVDELCTIGSERIDAVMGYGQINLFEYGTVSCEPCNELNVFRCILAGVAAAVLAYSVFLVVFLLDDRIQSHDDLEQHLGLPLLGDIPAQEAGRGAKNPAAPPPPNATEEAKRNPIRLMLPGNGDFAVREACKKLRTNLLFCGQDARVIAFSGCGAHEGRTTVALHTAKSLSELGKDVLFVDADLRNSVLAQIHTSASAGLGEMLAGAQNMEDVVHPTQYPHLQILFAGKKPENPVELLSSAQFERLLQQAREVYDYVLVDTPPLRLVIDAAVVAAHCDGTVLVVNCGQTRHRQAQEAVDQLRRSGTKILGVVRNHHRQPKRHV